MNQTTKLKLIEEINSLLGYIINDTEIFVYRSIQRLQIMAEKDLDSEDIQIAKTMNKF